MMANESHTSKFIKHEIQKCVSVRDEQGLRELKEYFWSYRKCGLATQTANERLEKSTKQNKHFSCNPLSVDFNFNPFALPASYFKLDLLTDSGTSNLTKQQIQFKKRYYENVPNIEIFSYACSTPRKDITEVMKTCFGEQFNFFPALQGRAAEKLLLSAMLHNKVLPHGSNILANRPFDTTKGHILAHGLTVKELTPLASPHTFQSTDTPFMGDLDFAKFENETKFECLLMTMTDNGGGGQPVSLKNLKLLSDQTHQQGKIVWVDGCRIYENACFVKALDPAYSTKSLNDIVKECVDLADVVTVSFKKMYSHSGGGIFINNNSKILTPEQIRGMQIFIQSMTTADYGNGYDSYSGLTGDGLIEIMSGMLLCLNEKIVARRILDVCTVGATLSNNFDLPILAGGHALYLAADQVLPNLKVKYCPAEYLNAILMKSLRIRGCGLGNLVYGGRHVDDSGSVSYSNQLSMDSLRLAVPREVYDKDEILAALSVLGEAYQSGLFEHVSGGLTPLDYVDNGFYHFGGKYLLNNEEEFNSVVRQIEKVGSRTKSAICTLL